MDIEEYSRKHIHFYIDDVPSLLAKYLTAQNWETYLDIGCGDGTLLYALNKKGLFKDKEVFAVDLSKNRLETVRKINKGFRLYLNDACNLKNIVDNSIDFAVSTQVIEHVPDDEKMVKEISRVLKKGGMIYLSTVFKKKYGWYFYRCNKKWVLDPTHVREYTNDNQLLDLFKEYNLRIVENKKSLISREIVKFIFRKMHKNRDIASNTIFRKMRFLQIPIPGYYNWEIVCRKL